LAGATALSCAPSLNGPGPSEQGATQPMSNLADEARAPLPPGAYDLGMAAAFSEALSFVAKDYFDKNRLRWLDMLRGSLEFVQQDTPEVLVEHWY